MQSIKIALTEVYGQTNQHIHFYHEKLGIHKEMVLAYQQLQNAAKQVGLELTIASGFRSFERQLMIWNNKFTGKAVVKDAQGNTVNINALTELEKIHAILLYSALPGASRHHWGCDIDIYAANLLSTEKTLQLELWEYQEGGPFASLSLWLTTHMQTWDFYFPYASYQGGVAAEPWHISYAPLSHKYQQCFNSKALANVLEHSSIQGKETIIKHLDAIIARYVKI